MLYNIIRKHIGFPSDATKNPNMKFRNLGTEHIYIYMETQSAV